MRMCHINIFSIFANTITVIRMALKDNVNCRNAMKNGMCYASLISKAVKTFWKTKEKQLMQSGDASNRGAVTGGKQMDGFVELLRTVAIDAGVPAECIITKMNYLPGYFRSTKDWDMLVISPAGKLIAAIELKSQIGSYGNNFNNRAEEAIWSAVDLWTAFREGQFPRQQAPWVGWLMVIGRDSASERVVRNYEPYFPTRSEFVGATYIDRYRLLCQKLVLERHYTSTALLWTSNADSYGDVSPDISVDSFISSFTGYLTGVANEFK